ncbi:putative restriction endonuclease [Hyella patelloides LEGE 07179]|uniref:Putative restriction endonuclease n=1 Tax=Hyella patelloides LEGE 07179 TaxID=945734 RepID=A0A563VUC8_9CYAN|nr:restriction endonuclease [Hyella patelloides]VEP15047.1 putative restriction endonuclease [Hyella patelloides LEGE 07179]
MSKDDLVVKILSQFKPNATQRKVFELLSDKQWHCRSCEGKSIASEQYAGGGGIQGLQRGTKNRPGLVIASKNEFCSQCQKTTRWDCWTGEIKQANAAANIPKKLIQKILNFYSYTDIIEQRQRAAHELVIDHRFPMERWGSIEESLSVDIGEDEIFKKFQLLKKDASGNHNLLKSRACERCIKEGKRGTPFGIQFWYEGNEVWTSNYQCGREAEQGCIGCGWYDFDTWRKKLNEKLSELEKTK